jgi:N-formylglutamate amidohydrolase
VRQSGGFITGRYGDPDRGRYALQLEVSREACGRDLARMQGILSGFWAFAAGELIADLGQACDQRGTGCS